MDLQLRQKYNLNLVLIKRGPNVQSRKEAKASIVNIPLPSTVLYKDDILMIAGADADLAKLPEE